MPVDPSLHGMTFTPSKVERQHERLIAEDVHKLSPHHFTHSDTLLSRRIEDVEGAVPTGAAIEQSEELESARSLESSFIDIVVQEMSPPVNFYRDPVEVLSVAAVW